MKAQLRLLVLGGTAWLGREIAREAAARGHDVTCLARGEAIAEGVRLVRADRDRDDALAGVATEHWDAVIDVARLPGHVRRAVRDLGAADFYIFVSTCNVYADQDVLDADEDAPLLEPLDSDETEAGASGADSSETETGEVENSYGRRKVACELAVLEAFGAERSLIARSGLIAGPGDEVGRTGYWPVRFAHPSADDGAVLVPDDPELSTQVVDVRDFATWLLRAAEGAAGNSAEGRNAGIFNVLGDRVPLGEHLAVARRVAGHTGPVVAAAPDWLVDHGVEEFAGPKSLPLWLSDPDWRGFMARSNHRAVAAGLELRPLEETLADGLAWEVEAGIGRARGAGLTSAEELELLAELELAGQ